MTSSVPVSRMRAVIVDHSASGALATYLDDKPKARSNGELAGAIQQLLAAPPDTPATPSPTAPLAAAALPAAIAPGPAQTVFVVDDDDGIRATVRAVLEEQGWAVEDFSGGAAFLAALRPAREGCLLVDAVMSRMDGFEVLRRLSEAGHLLPSVMITGHGDVPTAVRAMKAGALDFFVKPVCWPDLVAGVARALETSHAAAAQSAWRMAAAASIAGLTGRQRDVMAMVLAGHLSKNIAANLGISLRTVERHRAAITRKTGTRSLSALAQLAMAAGSVGGGW